MGKIYVHAALKIRIGGYEKFCEAMAKQIPILESYGWKLVGAWVTTIGRVYTVIDLWELPDANSFFEATAKWRAHPDFPAFRAVSKEVIEEEQISMVSKVPYSP